MQKKTIAGIIDEQAATRRRERFFTSTEVHQLEPRHHTALLVEVTASDNGYFTYPVVGVLQFFEMGTDLQISKAVFHKLNDDGSLGAPCVMDNVEFTYKRRNL